MVTPSCIIFKLVLEKKKPCPIRLRNCDLHRLHSDYSYANILVDDGKINLKINFYLFIYLFIFISKFKNEFIF